jgi:hypothetical protein
MPMLLTARLAETGSNALMAMAKKPLNLVKQASIASANVVSDVGGYHEVSIGAVKFRTGEGGESSPDTKYVDVVGDPSTIIADRCVAAIMQQAHSGHVTTEPLYEPMTVTTITYPVLTSELVKGRTDYVVTSLSLPNTLRVKCAECCCLGSTNKINMTQGSSQASAGSGASSSPLNIMGEALIAGEPHDEDDVWRDDDEPGDSDPDQEDLEVVRYALGENGEYQPKAVTPEAPRGVLSKKRFEEISKKMANVLRYNDEVPRDDHGGVPMSILAYELDVDIDLLDQVVWSSQGAHDVRFERIDYDVVATVRAKYKNKNMSGPEFLSTAYNVEAAKNVLEPLTDGTPRNTLGIFNDLYPGEKYYFTHTRSGEAHCLTFNGKVSYKEFSGEGRASTLQHAKALAMGQMLRNMLMHFQATPEPGEMLTNRQKKVFRAYGCLGVYKPDEALLAKVTECLTAGTQKTQSSRGMARKLGVTTRCINQLCYHHQNRFVRVSGGWNLKGTTTRGPISKKFFGDNGTKTVLSKMVTLREITEFHIQVPARYANLALAMTAGNTGVSNISYLATRFRTVLTDDDKIPSSDIDVYTNALALLAFITRHSSIIPYTNSVVNHKGAAALEICTDMGLTVDEKFAMLENEKRSRGGMHVLACYDATNYSGDYDSIRTIVMKNPDSKTETDQPMAGYRAAQVAPNHFGVPGPLDTRSASTWFSAIMRNMADGDKELCSGVKTVIEKKSLKGAERKRYLKAIKIIAKGDVMCFKRLAKQGKIGADCQKPPARLTPEQNNEIYCQYSDWYDRVGPEKCNHRMYVILGLIEKTRPEIMKTFCKGGETDDRGRLIQPTNTNDGHTVCNGNVVKVIAETVKLSRPANLFKGLTEEGKKYFFGRFRKLAFDKGGAIHCFDRSKQDHLTGVMLLEAYEDYMEEIGEAMREAGFDKMANTIFSSKNKDTKCTTDEFIILTEHASAMLTSACAQTSDANRLKTEVEALTFLLDQGWSDDEVQAVYDSWNNKDHYDLEYDKNNDEVYVPNSKMIFPMKYEGDDVTTLDFWATLERDNKAHCVMFAAFNKTYSTSWIPSEPAHDHGPLAPIDTLSVLYFSDNDRDKQNNSTKLASGRPDFAIPHPIKKAQSLVAMWSPTNLKMETAEDGTVNIVMNDHTRIAIVTAKTAQAETMSDLLWLRREATQSAQYWLTEYDDEQYMATAGPIWDPRDPEARGVAPTYEEPVVQRLLKVDTDMPGCDASKERLIANAEAWRLTCPLLANVPVATLAGELCALDSFVDIEGISAEDFDIRRSFQRVQSVAPNIAKVCQAKIAKTVGRLEQLGGEGTQARLEQQKEVVAKLLAVGGKDANTKGWWDKGKYFSADKSKPAATNEQSYQRRWSNWGNQGSYGSQRRGASDSNGSCSDRGCSGASSSWKKKW